MGGIPVDFIILLFCAFVVAVVLLFFYVMWKQRQLHRLKHPRRDYLKDE